MPRTKQMPSIVEAYGRMGRCCKAGGGYQGGRVATDEVALLWLMCVTQGREFFATQSLSRT